MATKKTVSRSKSQGNAAAKAPAAIINEAQAAIADNLAKPHGPGVVEEFAAAKKRMADIPVPMTLGEICGVIGNDVHPELFASEALAAIADQVETTAVIIDAAPDFSGDAWRLFKNIAERAKLASRVTAWLESEQPLASLPEVMP